MERSAEALELIGENVARFGVENVTVVAGEAPAAFAGLGAFDRIVVGGSGGRLAAILEAAAKLLRPGGRVVCNTICLETTSTVAAMLRRPPWTDFSCVQLSVARGVPAGPLLRFEALNPVWVTAADLAGTRGRGRRSGRRSAGRGVRSGRSVRRRPAGSRLGRRSARRGWRLVSAAIYGVGVGPGDAGLVTVRAAEVLGGCSAVLAPAPRRGGESLALEIAGSYLSPACKVVTAHFPMTEDRAVLEAAWDEAAATLLRLAAAPPVAFITLGDAMLYSTWSYLLAAILRRAPGAAVETIPGVTAMAACSAAVGRPLAEGREPLLVWPGEPPADPAALLDVAPNVVFMKADRHLAALAGAAEDAGAEAVAVRRASQIDARSTTDLRSWTDEREYFTTVLMHRATEDGPAAAVAESFTEEASS